MVFNSIEEEFIYTQWSYLYVVHTAYICPACKQPS